MIGYLDKALLRFARKKGGGNPLRGPLLIELLKASDSELVESYPNGLFRCDIRKKVDDGAVGMPRVRFSHHCCASGVASL